MRIESNTSYVPNIRLMSPAKGGVLLSVQDKDPVIAVQETYAMNQEGTGDRRYQILFMPLGNEVATFWTDLGPAEDFRMQVGDATYQAPPYLQLVLMEHDVAECRYMAEAGRFDETAVKLLHQRVEESDLFEKYAQLIEEDRYVVRNRSTFGAGMTKQRNGYSALAAREQQRRIRGY